MMSRTSRTVVVISALLALALGSRAAQAATPVDETEPSKLLVVWTSADKEVALKMVYMYTYNAKKNGWWDEVRFLIWGPSARLLAEDQELQEYVKKMKDEGVELTACKACADSYGVSEKLEGIGVKVFYAGKDLTAMLKSDWVTITF